MTPTVKSITDFADILRLPKGWHKEVAHTVDFVEEDLQPQLSPEKFCVNPAIHQYHVSLTDTLEHFHANQKVVAGLNPIGPLVILKGKVTSLFKEGWDNDYDETGEGVQPSLHIMGTCRRNIQAVCVPEMQAIIGGNAADNFHAFDFKDDDGQWKPYAERSTVLVFGRLKVRQTENDGEVPRLPPSVCSQCHASWCQRLKVAIQTLTNLIEVKNNEWI